MILEVNPVTVERQGYVITIILHRPKVKNAVDGPTASMLEKVFAAFESYESARVAVFCGADDVFCSGADLKVMASP